MSSFAAEAGFYQGIGAGTQTWGEMQRKLLRSLPGPSPSANLAVESGSDADAVEVDTCRRKIGPRGPLDFDQRIPSGNQVGAVR
jgi:hypothetical protein